MYCTRYQLSPSSCPGFPLDDGGSDITSYSVERKDESGDGAWQMVATVPDPRAFLDDPSTAKSSLSHSVSQLRPGDTYQFRVSAANRAGVRPQYSTSIPY